MLEYIVVNGYIKTISEPVISAADMGFLYGWGVFETLPVTEGKPYDLWELHFDRMRASADELEFEIDFSRGNFYKRIVMMAEANCEKRCIARATLTAGSSDAGILPSMLVTGRRFTYDDKYERGFSLKSYGTSRGEKSLITGIKSMNYLENMLVRHRALKEGYDEALLLNNDDFVAEGAVSNILWINENCLFTPVPECGILPGITRRVMLDICDDYGIKTEQSNYCLKAVTGSEGAFLTNAAMGIMPVAAINDIVVDFSERAVEMLDFIKRKYINLAYHVSK